MDKLGWSDGIASDDALIRFIDRICDSIYEPCDLCCPVYVACNEVNWF